GLAPDVRETRIRLHRHRRIVALPARAYRLAREGRPAAKTSLAREILDAQSSAQRDAKPSFGNLRGAQADAARSIPVAERNRNRRGVCSSVLLKFNVRRKLGARVRQRYLAQITTFSQRG